MADQLTMCLAFVDKNRVKFYAGESVLAVKITESWPAHVDGWGRTLPCCRHDPPDKPTYVDESVTGTIRLIPSRGEFIVLPDGEALTPRTANRFRNLWWYDRLERIKPESEPHG